MSDFTILYRTPMLLLHDLSRMDCCFVFFTIACCSQSCVPYQEAKEDAEMDAEIALEMEMERQRRLSTGSNHSSVGGTYVGPRPNSPGQVSGVTVYQRRIDVQYR